MITVEKLSDAELRAELMSRSVNVGPVTGTTRSVLEKKLKKLLSEENKSKPKTPVKTIDKRAADTKGLSEKSFTAKPESTKKSTVTKQISRKSISTAPLPFKAQKNITIRSDEEFDDNDEEYESDDDEEEQEEIISPKRNSSLRPISSTPMKMPNKTVVPANDKINSSSSSVKSAFSTKIDRPGATPPRISSLKKFSSGSTKTSIVTKSYNSSPTKTFNSSNPNIKNTFSTFNHSRTISDTGATTADEDDDCMESSRVIYSSKNTDKKSNGSAWSKVLGYDFKTDSKPGRSYDFRAGTTRTSVVRDPKSGKFVVKQTNVFGDALKIAFYTLIILCVVLIIGYMVTRLDRKGIAEGVSVVTSSVRDTLNFLYRYAIIPVLSALLIGVIGVGAWFGHKKYRELKEQEEEEFFYLVDKIIEYIRDSAIRGEAYVAQPHIRDRIFPPAKRRGAELARWERAVDFIDSQESRVSTEVRILPSGSECAIWKWNGDVQFGKN